MDTIKPSLFGIFNSNHDFTRKSSWGKNVFNNAFPVALTCFMYSKKILPVYITLGSDLKVIHGKISDNDLLGIESNNGNLYFDFESNFSIFQDVLIKKLPRVDVVTKLKSNKDNHLKALEIKLTTLPDNSTCEYSEDQYSTEIVVRPDTIVYMACSIALSYKNNRNELQKLMDPICGSVKDWSDIEEILDKKDSLLMLLDKVLVNKIENQQPLVLQPIWKTDGKSVRLVEDCLDVFVWSAHAFTRLFVDPARSNNKVGITRQYRSAVWLIKMLYEYSLEGKFNHVKIIDELSFNTKNDKAFADSGIVTYHYLKSNELLKPRVKKAQIKEIILGMGEQLLSPERRLDAVIQNTPDLFGQ